MYESLFRSSLRAFLTVLCGVVGLSVGLFLVLLLLVGSGETIDGAPEITYQFKPQILPNGDGIRKELSSDAPVILQININGVIGLGELTHKEIQDQLVEAGERSLKGRVKAILLDINTPGGTVIDADGIYRVLSKYKEDHKIPVYVFIDGMCASGGMYVSAVADKVYATDVSLIGSVGVILPTILNFSKLLDKFGIDTMTLYDGKGKDNLNPLRPWVKGEEDNIKDATKYYYDVFVDVITKNRPHLSKTKLINEYGANIYPAPLAKEYGYIDESGATLSQTLKDLVEKIGIKDDYYQVVTMEDNSWFANLFKGDFELFSGKMTHHLEVGGEIDSKLSNQYLYLYRP